MFLSGGTSCRLNSPPGLAAYVSSELARSIICGGILRVQCDSAPRANYYQVWLQIVGTDADYRLADFLPAPDNILEGLPAGATVNPARFAVRAMF